LFDWDQFVTGYLNGRDRKWQSKMKAMFAEKGYESDTYDYYAQAVEKYKGFFERNGFLFER
jgi:glucuronate isomerase